MLLLYATKRITLRATVKYSTYYDRSGLVPRTRVQNYSNSESYTAAVQYEYTINDILLIRLKGPKAYTQDTQLHSYKLYTHLTRHITLQIIKYHFTSTRRTVYSVTRQLLPAYLPVYCIAQSPTLHSRTPRPCTDGNRNAVVGIVDQHSTRNV